MLKDKDTTRGASVTLDSNVEPFQATLSKYDIQLTRETAQTLQVNTGLLCNQACKHCHLSAGPGSTAVMSRETLGDVLAYAQGRHSMSSISRAEPLN